MARRRARLIIDYQQVNGLNGPEITVPDLERVARMVHSTLAVHANDISWVLESTPEPSPGMVKVAESYHRPE